MTEKLKNKINDEQLKIRAISDEKITVKLTNNYAFQKIFKNTKIEIVEKNKQSEVRTVVADIPVYKGIALYVADKETGRIYGATDVSKIGVKLDDMGLRKQRKKIAKEKIASGIIRVDGKKNYYILKKTIYRWYYILDCGRQQE